MASRTLYQMFLETVSKHGTRPAVGFKTGKGTDYTYWNYRELNEKVRAFARGLDALGLKRGDSLAMLAENRVEWAVADLAGQLLGLIIVAPYSTLPASQVSYIVRDSSAKAIIISDKKQLAKVEEFCSEAPSLEHIIVMEGTPEQLKAACALHFDDIVERGTAAGKSDEALDALANVVQPDDIATLIYTSGTTGDPKGAMLSHANLLQTPDAVPHEPVAQADETDTFLSFLPLSHITERVGGHYLPIRLGSCIVYSQGLMALADEIQKTVRPTVMLCVPRLWENMYEKFRDRLPKLPEKQRKVVTWAVQVGAEVVRRQSEGKGVGLLLGLKYMLADKLALHKVREQVTGGRLRLCVSGGAPLDKDTATFFIAIGIQMLEGYGLSETNIIAINRPGRQRIGTVGNLMPWTEMKIAEDGEILMRGQGRMKGYFNKPEATAEAIDSEGWFHTGDIGELSKDGFLSITDRKKDLLVLTNGKKVAPQPIEAELKHSPFIGEAVLFGDKSATVSAILVPAFDKLLAYGKEHEMEIKDMATFLATPEIQKLYKGEVDKYTKELADYEKIRKFRLVDKPFGIESGELTPTLKVKRKFVAQKYADLVAAMTK